MFKKPNEKIGVLGDGVTAKAVREKLAAWTIQEYPISEADIVVTSPGIAPRDYPSSKAEFISEIEFAYRLKQDEEIWVGITGTNGKSTVTALLAYTVGCTPQGNIGTPLISSIDTFTPIRVIELSSYQLEGCSTFRPDIAVILNITPDHLERHITMENYAKAKANITLFQTAKDTLIIPHDTLIESSTAASKAQRVYLEESSPLWKFTRHFPLPGYHNKMNALAAILVCKALKTVSDEVMMLGLSTFKGLEHRIEFVCAWDKRKFYNDSKGTNPDSTLIAVQAFDNPIHLILGGKDKGLDLTSFLNALKQEKIKTIGVFGEIKERFFKEAHIHAPTLPLTCFNTFDEATEAAASHSQPDDIILFSPACSSFDQFKNFEDRGTQFKRWVLEHYGQL
jgi:UDP-N-acetylmuramoylalanine--D-glutamate ligase